MLPGRNIIWIVASALIGCALLLVYLAFVRPPDGPGLENTSEVFPNKVATRRERDHSSVVPEPDETSARKQAADWKAPAELGDQLQALADLPDDHDDRGTLIIAIATRWGQLDAGEAMLWAASLDVPEGVLAVRNILPGWVKKSPTAVLAHVQGMKELSSELRTNAEFFTLSFWAVSDFEAAWQASFTLKGDTGHQIRNHLLVEHSLNDPKASASALLDLVPTLTESKSYAGTAAVVARQLVCEASTARGIEPDSGKSVLDWAKRLPAGAIRRSAMSGALGQWAVLDPAAASTWLYDFPPGPERDAMIEEMANFTRDPDMSFLWAAEAMNDSEARDRVLIRSSIRWLEADPDAARKAIDANGKLSAGTRALIYDQWSEFTAMNQGANEDHAPGDPPIGE